MTLNKNKRAEGEYRLVTDGKQLYRLHPRHRIPKDVSEIFTVNGEKVYLSDGKMNPKFTGFDRIEPRNNIKYLTRCISHAIHSGAYHAS